MHILVLNAGSSSIKYCLCNIYTGEKLNSGSVENIRDEGSAHQRENYADLFQQIFIESESQFQFDLIAHRIVHGGDEFHDVTLLDPNVLERLRAKVFFAPLHNPENIAGIEIAQERYPGMSQFAVFDTGFHQTLPEYVYRYALPLELSDRMGIRRYGFHGISHSHVAKAVAHDLGKPLEELNIISLHLGNGASAAAIAGGRCIDTSMGMTPLEGLMMGSRCGDLDPGVLLYLLRSGFDEAKLNDLLNHKSGLIGICGDSDMRNICQSAEAGDPLSLLAIQMYCYRIKKIIGAYYASLGKLDVVVFTGGIGENSALIRAKVCEGMEYLGIKLDLNKNEHITEKVVHINSQHRSLAVCVVKTDEELEIAAQVKDYLSVQH